MFKKAAAVTDVSVRRAMLAKVAQASTLDEAHLSVESIAGEMDGTGREAVAHKTLIYHGAHELCELGCASRERMGRSTPI